MAAKKRRNKKGAAPKKAQTGTTRHKRAKPSGRAAPGSGLLSTPRLLVLQLDSDKLRDDGLDLARLATFLRGFYPQDRLDVVEGTSTQDLLDGLSKIAGRTFDAVLVIAHSSEHGVRLAADRVDTWSSFATWLKPFKPRRLVLVACDAGTWGATTDLFSGLPTLKEILASPVRVSLIQGGAMLLLPFLNALKPEQRLLLQGVHMAATGGQVLRWTRSDANNPEGIVLDVLAQAAHPAVEKLHKSLLGLLLR